MTNRELQLLMVCQEAKKSFSEKNGKMLIAIKTANALTYTWIFTE